MVDASREGDGRDVVSVEEIEEAILDHADTFDLFGSTIDLPIGHRDFDAVLLSLMPRLERELGDRLQAFRNYLGETASTVDEVSEIDTDDPLYTIRDMFVIPVVGPAAAVDAMAAEEEIDLIRRALHEYGVFGSDATTTIVPVALPDEVLARTLPGAQSILGAMMAVASDRLVEHGTAPDALTGLRLIHVLGCETTTGDSDAIAGRFLLGMRARTVRDGVAGLSGGDHLRHVVEDPDDEEAQEASQAVFLERIEAWRSAMNERFADRGIAVLPPAAWNVSGALLAAMRATLSLGREFAAKGLEQVVGDEVHLHRGPEVASIVVGHDGSWFGPVEVQTDLAALDWNAFVSTIDALARSSILHDSLDRMPGRGSEETRS